MRTPDWVTADWRHIPLSMMTTVHVINAMNYLIRGTGEYGDMLRPGCSGFTNDEWIKLFKAELTRRSRLGMTA